MSLTYDAWTNALFNSLAVASTGAPNGPTTNSSATDPQWLMELPRIVEYGENRIYRELDLLATRVTDATGTLTAGDRSFTLPNTIGQFLVLEDLYVVTPVTATSTNGQWNQLVPVSRSMLDASWPNNSSVNATSSGGTYSGQPQVYALVDNTTVMVGPAPDAAYKVVCVGTQRPTPLSSGNQTTFLTTVLPDLFMAATMVRASMFMRDWGAASDDPQMGTTWEQEYQRLLASANSEETRRMYRSAGWTAQMPRPESTPPRV